MGIHIIFYRKKKFFQNGLNYWLNDLPKNKELMKIDDIKNNTNKIKPIFIVGVPR